MKTKVLLLLAITFFLFFSSCKDEDKIKPSDVSDALSTGQWKIIYFIDSESNETSSFANYNFTFTITPGTSPATGLVEASNGSTDVVGSWGTGFIGDNAKLKLNFGLSPFDQLSEDWEVTELTSTTIKLKHVDDNTDFLTFELN
jgi:hypothetical protein